MVQLRTFVAATTVDVASGDGVVLGSAWNFASELLKSLALGLRNEQSREDTAKHEEGEDLNNVVQPRGCVGGSGTAGAERTNENLSDNGADLSRGGRKTMRSGTVASREDFTRNDECCGVRTWD